MIKPWMLAALAGALVGLSSRRWLSVEVGRGRTLDIDLEDMPAKRISYVNVIVGIGNTINYNLSRPVRPTPPQESTNG